MSNVIDFQSRKDGSHTRFPVAVGRSIETNRVENKEFTWQEFAEQFRRAKRTNETLEEYLSYPLDVQSSIKNVGHWTSGFYADGRRKKANLHKRYFVSLDIDFAPPDWRERIAARLKGLAYVCHSTHKHTKAKPRGRLIIPLSRGVDALEYQAICRRIASWWDMAWFDHTGFQFTRLLHYPSTPRDVEYEYDICFGSFVDADAVLETYIDHTDLAEWPITPGEDLRTHARTGSVQDPREKKGIIGAFCRCYSVTEAMDAFLPDTYAPGFGSEAGAPRFSYMKGSGSNGAVVYDGDRFLWSNHQSDPCSEKLVNAFDMVRLHKFAHLDRDVEKGTDGADLPSYKAMAKLAKQQEPVRESLAVEQYDLYADDFAEFDADLEDIEPEDTEDEAAFEVPVEQRAEVAEAKVTAPYVYPEVEKWGFIQTKDGDFAKNSLHNVIGFFECKTALQGCVVFNEFTGQLLQMRKIPGLKGRCPKEGKPWSDDAEIAVRSYIEKQHGICFPPALVHDAVIKVGNMHSINPPREWMRSLKWDGKPRLDNVLIRYLGVEDSPYVRAVTRKWFCQAVARLLFPGIKADHMLVLEGSQGFLKSTFLRTISKGWFSDDIKLGLDAKEIIERTRSAWIVEIQEMQARSASTHEQHLAMISRQSENARMAYARNAVHVERHFVFAGTTNESEYLTGVHGTRRFWPVRVQRRMGNVDELRAEVDQLWAEAKSQYLEWCEPLYIEDEAVHGVALEAQLARVESDAWFSVIKAFLEKPISAAHWSVEVTGDEENTDARVRRDRVCIREIAEECLSLRVDEMTPLLQKRIGKLLSMMPEWERHGAMRFGTRYPVSKGWLRKR